MSRTTLELLLARNRNHATRSHLSDPDYFRRHQAGQSPRCLWLGCADSRVAAENLVQAGPGELFVLRNVANQVLPQDDGVMSGIQYALTSLGVDTIIICGHLGCGGVDFAGKMAMMPQEGQTDSPLQRQMQPLSISLRTCFKQSSNWQQLSEDERRQWMVEENVRQQIKNLQQTPLFKSVICDRPLTLYGCIYDMTTGLLDVLSENMYAGKV